MSESLEPQLPPHNNKKRKLALDSIEDSDLRENIIAKYRTVLDLLSTQELITITSEATLADALKIMGGNSIRRLPVVDETGSNLIGIITERDLRLAADSPLLNHSAAEALERLSKHKVKDIMQKQVITVNDTDPIADAAKLMRIRKVDGLPVLNSKGALVGVVTRTDLLDHLIRILEPLNNNEKKEAV